MEGETLHRRVNQLGQARLPPPPPPLPWRARLLRSAALLLAVVFISVGVTVCISPQLTLTKKK